MIQAASNVIWRPQPGPQHALVRAGRIDEVLFGGARGGGKSDGMLGEFALHAHRYGSAAKGICFRRQMPQLEELISRSKEIYTPMGGVWREQKKLWVLPGGATLRFRPLERDRDCEKYQGQQFTRVYFEELTNFPSQSPYLKMFATLRSPHGVPCGVRATANPGGPGHNWVKARFIDAMPPMSILREVMDGVTFTRLFIPSLLSDNPLLTQADPGYVIRLKKSGSAELVRAWLEGDWDIVAGGMFDDVWRRDTHVVPNIQIPAGWRIDRSFDWGSSKPFSVGWWTESDGSDLRLPNGRVCSTVRGDLFRIGEWYGWNGTPNEGLRMLAVDIAKGIIERELKWGIHGRCKAGPADAAIFKTENGVCIAKDLMQPVLVGGRKHSIKFVSSNSGPGTRKVGWQLMRQMLENAKRSEDGPRERPGLFTCQHCLQFIRTIGSLPRDEKDPEDVDTDSEDHIMDESRYRVMFSGWRPRGGRVRGVAS